MRIKCDLKVVVDRSEAILAECKDTFTCKFVSEMLKRSRYALNRGFIYCELNDQEFDLLFMNEEF